MEGLFISMCNKQGLILINAFSNAQMHSANRFMEEFGNAGVSIKIHRNNEFFSWIKDGKSALCGFNYDFCVYYDQDYYVGKMLEKAGVLLFNNIQAIENCADKMLTHIELSNKGIDMPDTISGLWCYSENGEYSEKQLDNVIDRLGLPLVAKLCFGSSGDGVYLVKSYEELQNFCKTNMYNHYLFQRYIGSSTGKDIRVFVIGKKYVGAMLRENRNDFRSNIACKGSGRAFELDNYGIELCEKVATILDLDYCGIDLLLGEDGRYLVAEVNSNAFFREFEEKTGINIARTYVQHIIRRLNFM